MKRFFYHMFGISLITLSLAACSPEIGSEDWCEDLAAKDKGDWTANEATEYAKSCLFKIDQVGSKGWCEDLKKKDKGDWTANEAADYARNCLFGDND